MSLTSDDLKKLSAELPEDRIGVKVQSFSRDKTKAMLVLYLQHTDVMNRLEEVDPSWTAESLSIISPDSADGAYYVRMKLTLKGISRENVGEGNDPKGAYSDALKRCAMLFGVGRWLYDSETVWIPYNEATDRYRQFSIEDYKRAQNKTQAAAPKTQPSPGQLVRIAPPVVTPQAAPPQSQTSSNPEDCIIPYGRAKGKKIRDLSLKEMQENIDYWDNKVRVDGKPATGGLRAYLEALKLCLKGRSIMQTESDSVFQEEPFDFEKTP